jgi:hypothetical protein
VIPLYLTVTVKDIALKGLGSKKAREGEKEEERK